MRYRYIYKYKTGLTKVKTRLAIALTALGLGVGGVIGSVAIFGAAHAAGPIFVAPTGTGGGSCATPDYNTISDAVAAANSGDIIDVCPGVYTENVNVNKSLTINGAQAGIAVSGRTFASSSESEVVGPSQTAGNPVFAVNAPNVTIDGFSITDSVPGGAAYGVAVDSTGDSALVQNNIFDTITTTDTTSNGTAQAIYLQGGPDNVSILNNSMNKISSNRSAKGVLLGDNGATNAPLNTTIQGNTISEVNSDIRGAYGVSMGNATVPISGLQILDNSITGLTGGGWVHAIGVEGNAPSIVVNGNSISSLSSPGSDTIAVWFENEDTSFATAKVNNNNFLVPATEFGIAVQLTGGSLDGTCNYWNSPTGPTVASNPGGTGAQTTAGVTYSPWLIAPAPSGNCFGGHVPTSKDQCKNNGWQSMVDGTGTQFKNQGDCVSYVATGGKNTASGPKQH